MAHLRSITYSLALLLILLCAVSASAQQPYVGRFDFFGSYSHLRTPSIELNQHGFNQEFGVNVNRWLALGNDFSVLAGSTSLLPSQFNATINAKLAPLAPLFPPGYKLVVPINSTTFTYSAGPQINIRKFKFATFFVRPALGAMHQQVTAVPSDPIQMAVVGALVPTKKKSDTVPFYGVGWGGDVRINDRLAIRLGFDFVHTALFDGMLKENQNSLRISIGPTIRWGKNVPK